MELPYSSAHLAGIGGALRSQPEFFAVEEVPLYPPQGEGQHLYVNLTKVGLTTKEVQVQLQKLFGLRQNDVGFAGLKDKYARTTQTFSLSIVQRSENFLAEAQKRIAAALPVTVNWVQWHKNKLKAGHLLGNRFTITLTDIKLDADVVCQRAAAIRDHLLTTGVPNYFGPQRFGRNGANIEAGYALLTGTSKVPDRWLRRFLLSSYQSFLCNRYLARRVALGGFDQLWLGDVAKKYATGGMFDVADLATEQVRYAAKEISFTAPLYGPKMWAATAQAGELEAAILAEVGVSVDDFQRVHVEGGRRLGRLLAPDLESEWTSDGLVLRFFLPKGAFATTLVREFMKNDLANESGLEEIASDEEE